MGWDYYRSGSRTQNLHLAGLTFLHLFVHPINNFKNSKEKKKMSHCGTKPEIMYISFDHML